MNEPREQPLSSDFEETAYYEYLAYLKQLPACQTLPRKKPELKPETKL